MDWHDWYTAYDDPTSSLSRRLAAVRRAFADVLAQRAPASSRRQVVSICAGDGRDALPVLAAGYEDVPTTLVELDPTLAAAARREARRLGLAAVEVREADAGSVDAFEGIPRADVFLACGVFGNITDADLATTIATLPQLLASDAVVIWTRGRPPGDPTAYGGDPADFVRDVFDRHGFAEQSFERPADADYRVGVHRLITEPTERVPGAVMFGFVR
jgi:hypothetical protein